MTAGSEHWLAPAPDELLWMEDLERAVVYDRRSRQTHVLNPSAAAALKLLIGATPGAPLDATALGLRMAALDPPAGGAAAAQLAREILNTFDALGLIEPAGS